MRSLTLALSTVAVLTAASPAAVAQNAPKSSACVARNDVASLAGTRWSGRTRWSDGEAKQWTAYFRTDCVLEYAYGGVTYTNGHWLQRNKLVVWDTNDFYSVYTGAIDGRAMSGTMRNQGGLVGTWSFTRAN